MSRTVWALTAPDTPTSVSWETAILRVGRDNQLHDANCGCIIVTAREVRVRHTPDQIDLLRQRVGSKRACNLRLPSAGD